MKALVLSRVNRYQTASAMNATTNGSHVAGLPYLWNVTYRGCSPGTMI